MSKKTKLEDLRSIHCLETNSIDFRLQNKYGEFDVKVDKEDWDRIIENGVIPWIAPRYKKGKLTSYFRIKIGDRGKPRRAKGRLKHTFLHRWILGESNIPGNLQVDHINGNPLDNRKSNLRLCTCLQNQMNRNNNLLNNSKYTGVSYNTGGKKRVSTGDYRCLSRPWRATITLQEGKKTRLGTFKTEAEAAEAWDIAAYKHFKEFAHLNFPENIEKYKNLAKP